MAINFPSATDGTAQFGQPSGTSLLTSPDHAVLHDNLSSLGTVLESVLGTTAGTNVLVNLKAGEVAMRINNASGIMQSIPAGGTMNNMVMGSPLVTGGTMNNGVFGTATLQAPTINGLGTNSGTIINGVYNNPTFGTPTFNVWNGWIQANETATVLGTTSSQGINIGTLTVAATASNKYDKGDKVQFTQGGSTLYAYIYSIPSGTTILATGGTDYVIGTGAITNFQYSKGATPNGFPGWFNYTPGQQYGGTAPTTNTVRVAQFKLNGKECIVRFYDSYSTAGTINAGTINQPIPSNVSASQYHDISLGIISGQDNSTKPDNPPNQCTCFSNTIIQISSGNLACKSIYMNATYEI